MPEPDLIPVRLTDEQWKQAMSCIAQAPWTVANPLLMAMGEQLRDHAARKFPMPPMPVPEPETLRKKGS